MILTIKENMAIVIFFFNILLKLFEILIKDGKMIIEVKLIVDETFFIGLTDYFVYGCQF